MENDVIQLLSILEVLAIVANGIAICACFFLSATVLIKSFFSKFSAYKVSINDFDAYEDIFKLARSCSRCGFVFQFLGWVMLSSNQIGFIALPELTKNFAISWAAVGLSVLVFGIVSSMLCKETKTVFFNKMVPVMFVYSVLYFIVTFLIY